MSAEPSGIVEIKFRRDKIIATMARLDSKYAALKADANDAEKSADERASAEKDLKAREKVLYPTYVQIATEYADLHECVQPLFSFDRFFFPEHVLIVDPSFLSPAESVEWRPRDAPSELSGRSRGDSSTGDSDAD